MFPSSLLNFVVGHPLTFREVLGWDMCCCGGFGRVEGSRYRRPDRPDRGLNGCNIRSPGSEGLPLCDSQ